MTCGFVIRQGGAFSDPHGSKGLSLKS